ncbi:MAG: hypothetical protein ACHREM_09860 [Polyangiales bacterium]
MTTTRRILLTLVFLAALSTLPGRVSADPYRLRIDAVGSSQSPQSPVGLIVVQGEDRANPWIDAEALAWAGNGSGNADVLTALVRLHDPRRFTELRIGRQILTVGALRPLHIDGADLRVRSPTGTSAEVFAGFPVPTQLGYRTYDWATGGRIAQTFAGYANIGLSYLQERTSGVVMHEEAGLDLSAAPARWFDFGAHGAYDLTNPGVAEAGASLASRLGDLRPELYFSHRSPSRLMPATSLFSALGDTPSDVVGATVKWKMFPRLDLLPIVAARATDGDIGLDATLRATLRLDDKGEGALSLEGRRQGSGPERWFGMRATARVPLSRRVGVSTELELVKPDDPRGRGDYWPWALVALRWSPILHWEVAGAVEAASTATVAHEVNVLARLSWSGGAR